MCDLTVEVLVDDAVDFIFGQLEKKDEECRTQAADADDYDRLFKKWLSETLCDLAGKCEDMGYYRGGGRQGLEESIDQQWSDYWDGAGRNIGPDGLGVADVREAFEAGCRASV